MRFSIKKRIYARFEKEAKKGLFRCPIILPRFSINSIEKDGFRVYIVKHKGLQFYRCIVSWDMLQLKMAVNPCSKANHLYSIAIEAAAKIN